MECSAGLRSLVVFVLLLYSGVVVNGTSLMKRIRERQNADDTARGGTETGGDTWIQIPQPVQDVLLSIDDKLRSLDTFSYTRKLASLDFSLDQLVRRMESVESKLGRLETKFDLRMERVEEIVVSKDIKGEFSNEQLTRRMDSLNEKVTQRAAYLEARIDLKVGKVVGKLDSLERDLHSSVDEVLERLVRGEEKSISLENEIIKGEEKLDELGAQVNGLISFSKGELANTINRNFEQLSSEILDFKLTLLSRENKSEKALTDIQTRVVDSRDRVLTILRDSSDKIDNLSSTCHHGQRGRSGADTFDLDRVVTQEQMENLTAVLDKALSAHEAKFKELDSDVEMYTRKVINGIQELWRTSDELKSDLSNTLEQGSKTREIVRQEFQRLHEQIEPLPKLEPKLTDISEDLDKKVFELSATVDNSFATLLVAQNTFIDSCKRIQQEETHIYDILQQIVYEMRNRSISDIHKISSELRSQSSEINKSLAHVLTAVLLTGNITTAAVNDLLKQLKKKDQCVILKTDSIDWNVMESICNQLSADERLANPSESRNASDSTVNHNILNRNILISEHKKVPIEVMYDTESDPSDPTSDPGLNLQDYEMDYQLSESY